jgi:hypothetical protein
VAEGNGLLNRPVGIKPAARVRIPPSPFLKVNSSAKHVTYKYNGGSNESAGILTLDLRLKRPLLYRLSYTLGI